jgi:hypothetical protein
MPAVSLGPAGTRRRLRFFATKLPPISRERTTTPNTCPNVLDTCSVVVTASSRPVASFLESRAGAAVVFSRHLLCPRSPRGMSNVQVVTVSPATARKILNGYRTKGTTRTICAFGWKARDFALKAIDGRTYSLADVRGPKGTLVIFICITYRRASGEWGEFVCQENKREYYAGKDTAVPTADKPDF